MKKYKFVYNQGTFFNEMFECDADAVTAAREQLKRMHAFCSAITSVNVWAVIGSPLYKLVGTYGL